MTYINVTSPDNIADGGIFTSASDENADIAGLQRAFTVTTSCTGDNLYVRLFAGEGADPNSTARLRQTMREQWSVRTPHSA